MVKTLEKAIAEISSLPEEAQEKIGRELLSYLERLKWLRDEIDEGIRSLETEGGRELDADEFLREIHREHAKKQRHAGK
jgi:hypothetical protein